MGKTGAWFSGEHNLACTDQVRDFVLALCMYRLLPSHAQNTAANTLHRVTVRDGWSCDAAHFRPESPPLL